MKRKKDIPAQEKARSHGYCCPYRQWGTSGKDPGIGSATFYYPVTCNPCIAFAGTTRLGTKGAADAVVITISKQSCIIDSTPAEYLGTYRVVVIGRC